MAQIDLDYGKLLGFRLLDKETVAELQEGAGRASLTAAKTGLKDGKKSGPTMGLKMGAKLGMKAGGKLVAPTRD